MVANLMAERFARLGRLDGAGLHDARMQVQVVRHHSRAQNADGQVQRVGVGHDFGARHQPAHQRKIVGVRGHDFIHEAPRK